MTPIPEKLAKIIWLIFTATSIVAGGAEATLVLFYGQDSKYVAVTGIAIATLGTLLRLFTTNSFTLPADKKDGEKGGADLQASLLIMVMAGAALLSSCAFFNRVGKTIELSAPGVVECVGNSSDAFAQVASVLTDAVMSGKVDLGDTIDGLVKSGPGVACIVKEVLLGWQQAGPGAGVAAPPTPELRQRFLVAAHLGQAHLAARGYLTK